MQPNGVSEISRRSWWRGCATTYWSTSKYRVRLRSSRSPERRTVSRSVPDLSDTVANRGDFRRTSRTRSKCFPAFDCVGIVIGIGENMVVGLAVYENIVRTNLVDEGQARIDC